MTKSRGIIAPKFNWQPEHDMLLRALYPCSAGRVVAKLIGCTMPSLYNRVDRLNIEKSDWFKAGPISSRLRRGDNIGINTRFKKGQVSFNKGLKGICYPGSIQTQFKPGTKPSNWKPVGSIRVDSKDGYLLIKMAEGMFQWKLLHRIIYERMHGSVPAGYIVHFIDENKLNISITNLSIITRKQNALRNSVHNHGPEIAELYRLQGQIKRQINKRTKENHGK